ncbi:hypothetical protein [Clostridium sp. CCUG 7971]|uniref:hypothetical protein n=1 Tax=Clostridium sp. CCUG 7971 TaxID=2811414 RepID=UPI001ABB9AA9|nr:hypothetical protein [Clostridium sp. CCUG 7971]MBO3444938.1 hypothetical protein [Clostridium sp. CCUG 7971]
MERNYWQEYWDNYYKFMAVYIRELQNAYPNADITNEYVEVANLFAPSMPFEDYENYDEFDDGDNYSEEDNDPPFISPSGGQSAAPFASPGGGQSPTPFISPGGGQFTINNCRRMAIVRIEMRRGFNPSNFFLIVDRADRRSIQGFRIACEAGRVRFIPMAVEYRNINLIECAF